jgi:hypothetical protein
MPREFDDPSNMPNQHSSKSQALKNKSVSNWFSNLAREVLVEIMPFFIEVNCSFATPALTGVYFSCRGDAPELTIDVSSIYPVFTNSLPDQIVAYVTEAR